MCIGKWLQAKSERAQLQAQLQAKVQAELQAELQEYKYMRKLLQQLLFWLDILSSVSSGFRNLLLDGRWLEFWEIILLAAGDVERNPGPTGMSPTDVMHLDLVQNCFHPHCIQFATVSPF